jgi:hypothetical protein
MHSSNFMNFKTCQRNETISGHFKTLQLSIFIIALGGLTCPELGSLINLHKILFPHKMSEFNSLAFTNLLNKYHSCGSITQISVFLELFFSCFTRFSSPISFLRLIEDFTPGTKYLDNS